MTHTEEKELMPLALAGNVPARNAIVLSILPLIQRDIGRICRYRQAELVNIAVLNILENFNHFKAEFNVRAYTYFAVCVRNKIKRYLKQDKTITSPYYYDPLATVSLDNVPIATGLMPDQEAEQFETIAIVARALRRLPARYRQVLELRYNGYKLRECGEIMGITRERVRQLQEKAEVKIKRLLEKWYEESCSWH